MADIRGTKAADILGHAKQQCCPLSAMIMRLLGGPAVEAALVLITIMQKLTSQRCLASVLVRFAIARRAINRGGLSLWWQLPPQAMVKRFSSVLVFQRFG